MDKSLLRLIGAVLVGAMALAATSMDLYPRMAIGAIIGLPSFVLIIVGRRQLGQSFSIMPEAKALISAGLYSKIQHPLYFFLDLFLIGVITALGMPILLLAWSLLVAVHLLQCRREEKVLANAFGAAYDAYRARTWL
jgi:protein-S-isoprenylcysteine O-methyltransferase Ste14